MNWELNDDTMWVAVLLALFCTALPLAAYGLYREILRTRALNSNPNRETLSYWKFITLDQTLDDLREAVRSMARCHPYESPFGGGIYSHVTEHAEPSGDSGSYYLVLVSANDLGLELDRHLVTREDMIEAGKKKGLIPLSLELTILTLINHFRGFSTEEELFFATEEHIGERRPLRLRDFKKFARFTDFDGYIYPHSKWVMAIGNR